MLIQQFPNPGPSAQEGSLLYQEVLHRHLQVERELPTKSLPKRQSQLYLNRMFNVAAVKGFRVKIMQRV